jgi:hypothetical protein
MLEVFSNSERAGILSGMGYKYYRYPNSISHTLSWKRYHWDINYLHFLRLYLNKQYAKRIKSAEGESPVIGTISKTNEEFLFAILLSLMQESFTIVRESDESCLDKIALLRRYFDDDDVVRLFRVDAGPQYRNLAARPRFIHEVMDWVLAQTQENEATSEAIQNLTQRLKSILETIPVGHRHRLANNGEAPLEVIEVQSGQYLGEDDIVRHEDDTGGLRGLDNPGCMSKR